MAAINDGKTSPPRIRHRLARRGERRIRGDGPTLQAAEARGPSVSGDVCSKVGPLKHGKERVVVG